MKLLVTGSSGQVGSYLIEGLRDHEVTGLDLRPGPRTVTGDVRDPDLVSELCAEADAVIHLAAQVSVERSLRDPLEDMDINSTGTVNLLRAASEEGVGLFVHVSTAAVYGDPQYLPVDEGHPTAPKSFYGVSKLSAEWYVRTFGRSKGLPYLIVRPFNLYSPRADPDSPYSGVITRFVQRAMRGRPLVIEGDGEQTRDFVHVLDLVRMISLLLGSGLRDRTLNCASGRGTSINQLARAVVNVSPREVGVERGPSREGDIRHSVGEASRARDLLGFSPAIPLEEGLSGFFRRDG
ncbi:MAG: NAD-dependent epimerase/dehydratase family protein [Methanomassiliicoccales archaeon]